METNMNNFLFPTERVDPQQRQLIRADDAWTHDHSYLGYPAQEPSFWPTHFPGFQHSVQHPHFSISTQSSFTPQPRTSIGSASSQRQSLSSVASTNSSWSDISNQPYTQRAASLESAVYFTPPTSSYHTVEPILEQGLPAQPSISRRRNLQHRLTPEKDTFTTCVSRTRRSRRSQREPRYWCTSCEEPFIEKYDWKRHEETYQERKHLFGCSLCSAIYFLEKDFLYHHETRHNCETCQREGHLDKAKQSRQARSGWGCGFCTHFSSDWKERCNHVAQHFEEGKPMKDWLQSNVIYSLLHRPEIYKEWSRIWQTQPQLGGFGWNRHDTGRVEGYPGNNTEPNLQDRLEYYKPGDNAAALAQFAFDKIAFPSHPPQAPRKDYKDHHTATLQDVMADTERWNSMMSSIPEDNLSPTNVCDFDFSMINDHFGRDTEITY